MRLTQGRRDEMPKSQFAGPNRSYPVNDPVHAKLAKAMAARFASPGERAQIDARADSAMRRFGMNPGS